MTTPINTSRNGSLKFNDANGLLFEPNSIQDFTDKRRFLCFNTKPSTIQEIQIVLLIVGVIASGGFNRVAAKIMTVPMREYSFFLGLFNSLVYVLLYFSILGIRYYLGHVPKDDFIYAWKHKYKGTSIWQRIPPWKYFIIMGLMDGLGNILGLIATPYLDGPMISLLNQTIVVFSVICAIVILRTTYTFWQIWCVFMLLAGVMISLMPSFTGGTTDNNLVYSLVMAFSTLPNAISFTYKELLFREKPDLDVFIVNSHGSLFQLILQPVFLPLTLIFNQTGGKPLSQFISEGFQCFGGTTPAGVHDTNCSPNPYPYLVYITINLVFNIMLLMITKKASALLSFMAIKAILPLSVLLFYFKWPLLSASEITAWDWSALVVIVISLFLYRFMMFQKNEHQLGCMSFRLPFLDGCYEE